MAEHEFVESLPDLIEPQEYEGDPHGRRVRLRVRWTETGLEVLGDAVRPEELEQILEAMGAEVIEQMLCG